MIAGSLTCRSDSQYELITAPPILILLVRVDCMLRTEMASAATARVAIEAAFILLGGEMKSEARGEVRAASVGEHVQHKTTSQI